MDDLKTIALEWGDSLVIAGSASALRLHIHTDNPAGLFYSLRNTGTIFYQKADDMKKQFDTAHRRKFDIALVTDSSCDLPADLMDKYQIQIAPINIYFGDNQYLDKVTITPDNFYRMLDESRFFPSTSQVTQATFQNIYSRLTGHYSSVIALHLSGEFSGTYSSSLLAAAGIMKETGTRINVVNSRQVSGSLGLIVLKAAREIEAGKTLDEITGLLESWISSARIFVGVKTMRYLVKGGRVSRMKGLIANILNLKPIISLDEKGKASFSGKAFSWKGSLNNLFGQVKSLYSEKVILEYCILHAGNPDDSQALAVRIEKLTGMKPVYSMNISPVVGLNAGVGAVAVAIMTE
jgi:DegV family protein with EDD domain